MPHAIIQFLNGGDDLIITKGSNNLRSKRGGDDGCAFVDVPAHLRDNPQAIPNLQNALAGVGSNSIIYLRGHGNFQAKTVGGWTAREIVILLKLNGLATAKVISITGCNAARAPDCGEQQSQSELTFHERKAEAAQIMLRAANSFAGELHAQLAAAPNAITGIPVTGRTYSVNVTESGAKTVRIGPSSDMKAGTGSARFSKVVFRWRGAVQECEWMVPKGEHHDYYDALQ